MKDFELKLISELMRNSRIGDRELAKALGASLSRVVRTRRKLEKVGAIKTPVEILVENGRAVKIKGAEEAEKIKAIIKAGDNNASNIAELGIGTNHTMKELSGTVGDKMMIGTAHLAIGKNINIGGQTFSNIHHDGVMKDVTIEIDEKKILKNGSILV